MAYLNNNISTSRHVCVITLTSAIYAFKARPRHVRFIRFSSIETYAS